MVPSRNTAKVPVVAGEIPRRGATRRQLALPSMRTSRSPRFALNFVQSMNFVQPMVPDSAAASVAQTLVRVRVWMVYVNFIAGRGPVLHGRRRPAGESRP